MKIRFETTIDDVIAFTRFHFAHSPAWRRTVWTQSLFVPAILAGMLLLAYYHRDVLDVGRADNDVEPLFAITIICLVSAVGWVFFIRWYLNFSLGRNTRKFHAEGSNRAMFGWREMEIVDNRLVVKTELIHSILDLRAIEKIVGVEQFTYVYTGSAKAYFIPMNLYPEDEYRQFVAELREAWENRDAPRPVEEPEPRKFPTDERIVDRPH